MPVVPERMLPAPMITGEDVALVISGINVADPEDDSLVVSITSPAGVLALFLQRIWCSVAQLVSSTNEMTSGII